MRNPFVPALAAAALLSGLAQAQPSSGPDNRPATRNNAQAPVVRRGPAGPAAGAVAPAYRRPVHHHTTVRVAYVAPRHYHYHDNGPTAGQVIAGVAVTSTLIAVLASASQPKTVTTAGAPPPPPPAYAPPPNATGKPAKIDVDLAGLTPEARPSANTCIAETSRQIGATGGLEIAIASIDKVEPGNGGYRFNLTLLATYPDAKRKIPMLCRATPEKIVELKFG